MGRAPIEAAKVAGLQAWRSSGLKLLERGIPRHGYAVFDASGQDEIGEMTSGTQSPSLKQAIGIAYVTLPHAAVGSKVTVDIRGAKIPAEVVPTPFYKRPY